MSISKKISNYYTLRHNLGNILGQRNAIHLARPDVLDGAVAVDEEGGGQAVDVVAVGDGVVGVEGDGEGEAEFVDKLLDCGWCFGLIDADDQYFIAETISSGLERGQFVAAGSAPGGPEVEDDRFF